MSIFRVHANEYYQIFCKVAKIGKEKMLHFIITVATTHKTIKETKWSNKKWRALKKSKKN